MKNYEIGRLAEGVLRGAKMIIVFERERSVLESVVVFERERLYRPSEDAFRQTLQNCENQARKFHFQPSFVPRSADRPF